MSEITAIWLDLAKNVFQVHGADGSGRAVLRKKLRRDQVLSWGRKVARLGHEVRLIPPAYVSHS